MEPVDFVLEVASPSTFENDLTVKAEAAEAELAKVRAELKRLQTSE